MQKTARKLKKIQSYRIDSISGLGGYTPLPQTFFKLLETKTLTNKEFIIFTFLHSEAMRQNNAAPHVGTRTIASVTGSERKTVKRMLDSIEKKGLISSSEPLNGSRNTKTYTIELDALKSICGLIETNGGATPPTNETTGGTTPPNGGGDTPSTGGTTPPLINYINKVNISISDTKRKKIEAALHNLSNQFDEDEIIEFLKSKNSDYFNGIKFGFEKYLKNGIELFRPEYEKIKQDKAKQEIASSENRQRQILAYKNLGWYADQINNQLKNLKYKPLTAEEMHRYEI